MLSYEPKSDKNNPKNDFVLYSNEIRKLVELSCTQNLFLIKDIS